MSASTKCLNEGRSCTLVLETKNIGKLHSCFEVWIVLEWLDIRAFGEGHPAFSIVSNLAWTIRVAKYLDTNSAQIAQCSEDGRHGVGCSMASQASE